MASELLKNRALIQKLKEPEVPRVNFDLASTGFEELFTLPEPKPQELLEIQEQNRKQRLLESLQKIGPGLMDESLDFIRREEFSKGSLPKSVQDFLVETFPDVDFDFTRAGKLGVPLDKTDPESVNLYAKIGRAARAKIKNPNYTVNPALSGEGQAYSVKKAEEAVAEFKKKEGRLPYPKELPEVIGKSKTQTYRILRASKKNLTTPFPQDKEGVLMKKNIAEENKSIKKGMDIIREDYKKFKKTALPNQKYYVSPNLLSFRDVNGNKKTISGSPKTRNKIIDNLIEEGLDIIRAPDNTPTIGGERVTTGLSKKERDYFKKNYKNKSLGEMTRKFLPEGTGTVTAPYDRKIAQFRAYRNELLNQKAIKDKDLIKPLEFEPKAPGQADRESTDKRLKSLDELGVQYQEETFANIKREIADEIYGKKAFVTDKRGNTRVRIDQGHRGGYEQFQKLGANYPIASVGPDLDDINRKNIKLVENKLKPLYEKQVLLFNKAKKNLTSELRKSIDANNKDIAQLVAKAQFDDPKIKGRIIGVQVDPFNLKVGTTPIDYTKALDLGVLDDAIKIGIGKQGKIDKFFIKENYKALLLKEGAEQGFLKKGIKIPTEESGQKKLTALQKLASRTGAGVDPSLLLKAGFEEFVKPGAKIGARGAATLADLAISVGPGAKGLGLGLLLEADPIITGMSQGKTFGQSARDTFVGSAIDAIPGVNLGSLNEDLLKLADTEEEKVGVQNVIDYQRDADQFKKRFENYKYLEDNPFEAEGVDLIAMEKGLLNDYLDLQSRKPKVQNPEVFSILEGLARKEAIRRKENLEGIQGVIFGDRMAKDPNFIDNQIRQILAASTGAQGATDSYTDAYKFLSPEQVSPEELDERFDMEGGIMAANGGRIGFADGPIDPKRRTFMKIMAGIASLPIFSKFLGKSEVVKPVVKVAGSSTKMPEWFPDLVNKVMFSGTGKRVDADLTIYEPKELPGISIGRYDDGRVFVEGENEYGKKYMIEYEPPGFELIDEKTGKAVKKPGEFIAQEEVPVNVDPDGNADFDVEVLDDLDQILGTDTRAMEEFATGRKVKDMKQGEFAVGKAEADADRAIEEAAEMAEDID